MCINREIKITGINIETVNWSNKNSHDIDINSESNQLPKFIYTGLLHIPTS